MKGHGLFELRVLHELDDRPGREFNHLPLAHLATMRATETPSFDALTLGTDSDHLTHTKNQLQHT